MSAFKAKHFYLYACIILWLAVSADLIIWYSGQSTLSMVAATNGASHLVDAVGAITAAFLTFLFLKKWFFEETGADVLKRLLFYLATAFMAVIAIVPASAGNTLHIHAAFATLLSLTLVAILLAYIFDKGSTVRTRIYALLTAATMLLGVILFSGILTQIIGIVAFNLFILSCTYSKLTRRPSL